MQQKRVMITVGLVLLLAGFAGAGTPQIQQGSAALYFPFNGLSTLSYDNTNLGVQYFIMNKVALGLGIGFNTERDKADNDDDPAITRSISGDGAIYYYPIQKGAVAMYVAPEGGLELSTDYLKVSKIVVITLCGADCRSVSNGGCLTRSALRPAPGSVSSINGAPKKIKY